MSVKKFFCLLVLSASICCLFSGCGRIRYYWYKLTGRIDDRVWLNLPKEKSFVGDKEYAYKKNAQCLHIPSNIKTIGREAFRDGNFECVQIDEGLEVIGYEAFAGCEKLKEVNIPKSVKTIGEGAFKDCPCEESVKRQFPAYR